MIVFQRYIASYPYSMVPTLTANSKRCANAMRPTDKGIPL